MSADQTIDPIFDPKTVGFIDAILSGFYLNDSGELLRGMVIGADDVVLDVGCGGGLATLFCAKQGAHVVYTDVSREKIEALGQRLAETPARRLEGHVSDSSPLPLPDEYATKVLAMEVLEHTEKPADMLRELVRVGRHGAQYLITVPDPRSEAIQKGLAPRQYFQPPNHIQVFDKDAFVCLVEDAGLVVENYATWGFYWSMWWCLKWLDYEDDIDGEVVKLADAPYSALCLSWSAFWQSLQASPGGRRLIERLNDVLPKSQGVIARKVSS